jgi:hypothetical protein
MGHIPMSVAPAGVLELICATVHVDLAPAT